MQRKGKIVEDGVNQSKKERQWKQSRREGMSKADMREGEQVREEE